EFLPLRLSGQLRYVFSHSRGVFANKTHRLLDDYAVLDGIEILVMPLLERSVAQLCACLHSMTEPTHDADIRGHPVVIMLVRLAWNPPIAAHKPLLAWVQVSPTTAILPRHVIDEIRFLAYRERPGQR